jgi:hypothetical protein
LAAVSVSNPRRQQFRRLRQAGKRALGAVGLLVAAIAIAAAGAQISALVVLVAAGGLALASRHALRLAGRSRIGADSEADVRRLLQALTNDGWSVRHAIDWAGSGDLDHVARTPSGLGFVIETKTRTFSAAHVERTVRAARWLGLRRRRYPAGVVAVICVTRPAGVERVEAGVLFVSLDRLVPTLRRHARERHDATAAP